MKIKIERKIRESVRSKMDTIVSNAQRSQNPPTRGFRTRFMEEYAHLEDGVERFVKAYPQFNKEIIETWIREEKRKSRDDDDAR